MFSKFSLLIFISISFERTQANKGYECIDNLKSIVKPVLDKWNIVYVDFAPYADNETLRFLDEESKEVDKLAAQFDAVKDDARSVGVDISNCLEENDREDNFVLRPAVYAETIGRVIANKLFEGRTIIMETKDRLNEMLKEVDDLKSELDKCGEELECVNRISTECSAKEEEIRRIVPREDEKTDRLVSSVKQKLVRAARRTISDLVRELQQIIDEVKRCSEEKKKWVRENLRV